jgi:hypothetical protein
MLLTALVGIMFRCVVVVVVVKTPQKIAEIVPLYSLRQLHSKSFPAYNEFIF